MLSTIQNTMTVPKEETATECAAAEVAKVANTPAAAEAKTAHETWGALGEAHSKRADAKHLCTKRIFGHGYGKVLKQVAPDLHLTQAAAATVDDLLAQCLQQLVQRALTVLDCNSAGVCTDFASDGSLRVLDTRTVPGRPAPDLLVDNHDEYIWTTRVLLRTEETDGRGAAALAAWDAADEAARAAAPAAHKAAQVEAYGPGGHDGAAYHAASWEQAHGRLISSRAVQTAVRLTLPGELAKHAVSEGTKAVTKVTSCGGGSSSSSRAQGDPLSAAAGLQFSVAVVGELMARLSGKAVSDTAATYLASCLEYLSAECLEIAGNAARDERCGAISHRHLLRAIGEDEELDRLFPGAASAVAVAAAAGRPWALGGARAVADDDGDDAGSESADEESEGAAKAALALAVAADEAAGLHYAAGAGVLRIADGGGGDASSFGSGEEETVLYCGYVLPGTFGREVLGRMFDPASVAAEKAAEKAAEPPPRWGQRSRKVLRDNIGRIGNGMIRRLAVRAGVPAVHPAVYDETRGVIKCKLENLVRDAVTFCESRRDRTVSPADAAFAIAHKELDIAASTGSGTAVALLLARTSRTLAAHRIAVGPTVHACVSDTPDNDWIAAAIAVRATWVTAAEDSDGGDDNGDGDDGDDTPPTHDHDRGDSESKESEAGGARAAAHRAHVRAFQPQSARACEQRALPFEALSGLIAEIGQDYKTDLDFDARAVAMLGAVVESHVVRVFQRAVGASSAGVAAGSTPAPLSAPHVARVGRELRSAW